MLDILIVTTPIFLLIGLGYGSVRLGYFDAGHLGPLSAFVVRVALPVLMFKSVSQRSFGEVLNLRYLAAYGLGSLATFAAGLAWSRWVRRQPLEAGAVQGLGMSCSNSAFIGLPIVHLLLGTVASLALALCMLIENLIMLPLSLALADSAGQRHVRFRVAFLHSMLGLRYNSLVMAICVGLVFSALALPLPAPLVRAIDLMAAGSAPAALFYIGGCLVGLPVRQLLADVGVVAVGKLWLHPGLVALAMWLLWPTGGELALAGVLMASMPMMSIYPVIGRQHGQQGFCAAALLAATVASFFTIGVNIWILRASGLFLGHPGG